VSSFSVHKIIEQLPLSMCIYQTVSWLSKIDDSTKFELNNYLI